MTFEDDQDAQQDQGVGVEKTKKLQTSSCFHDIIDHLAKAKIAQEKEAERLAEEEAVPIRDRDYTKEQLKELEKKKWCEIKDLIFQTEP